MGVLSEAGCPGIADPGNLAVAFAHRKKIKVIPLVGPSSILLALMASGFNGQTFVFHGYLPIDKNLRNKALASIERDAMNKGQTQIFMETPYRNNKLLREILRVCKSETKLCIARNITGENELIESKSVGEWRKNKLDLHKQPTIFLLSA